ncbi:MAG: class I SAM-dependent methyltransferase [Bacteroidales bacterium]|nr:class I SAM-dependent methyltransferase [Bacteroidales bacterium]
MKNTDWDSYYSHPFKTSTYSRKITSNKLIRLLNQFAPKIRTNIKIAELGGANSCFYEIINKEFNPIKYLIVDNNQLGLDKTLKRLNKSNNISLKYEDVLNSGENTDKFDIVFSVGLIEHFSYEDTKKCIAAHFDYLESNGICIITFPTPTWLYKITRKCAELLGIWIFYDERPLSMDEVINEVKKYGLIKYKSITWPIFLTQGVILAIKN